MSLHRKLLSTNWGSVADPELVSRISDAIRHHASENIQRWSASFGTEDGSRDENESQAKSKTSRVHEVGDDKKTLLKSPLKRLCFYTFLLQVKIHHGMKSLSACQFLARWFKKNAAWVQMGQVFETLLETDKGSGRCSFHPSWWIVLYEWGVPEKEISVLKGGTILQKKSDPFDAVILSALVRSIEKELSSTNTGGSAIHGERRSEKSMEISFGETESNNKKETKGHASFLTDQEVNDLLELLVRHHVEIQTAQKVLIELNAVKQKHALASPKIRAHLYDQIDMLCQISPKADQVLDHLVEHYKWFVVEDVEGLEDPSEGEKENISKELIKLFGRPETTWKDFSAAILPYSVWEGVCWALAKETALSIQDCIRLCRWIQADQIQIRATVDVKTSSSF